MTLSEMSTRLGELERRVKELEQQEKAVGYPVPYWPYYPLQPMYPMGPYWVYPVTATGTTSVAVPDETGRAIGGITW